MSRTEPQPVDGWGGMVGFIQQRLFDHYLEDHPDPTEIEYYLSGPPLINDALCAMLDKGLGKDRLRQIRIGQCNAKI